MGNIVIGDTKSVELLNEYFSSVFTVEDMTNIPNTVIGFNNNCEILNNINITVSKIIKKLNDINVNKSLGPDNLHPKLLFELRNHLVKPLTKLYNLCIEQGIVPQDWKVCVSTKSSQIVEMLLVVYLKDQF